MSISSKLIELEAKIFFQFVALIVLYKNDLNTFFSQPIISEVICQKTFFFKKIENALVFGGAHRGDFAKKIFFVKFHLFRPISSWKEGAP